MQFSDFLKYLHSFAHVMLHSCSDGRPAVRTSLEHQSSRPAIVWVKRGSFDLPITVVLRHIERSLMSRRMLAACEWLPVDGQLYTRLERSRSYALAGQASISVLARRSIAS